MPMPVVLATPIWRSTSRSWSGSSARSPSGRAVAAWVIVVYRPCATARRCSAPLYLVTIAGDWLFVLFVAAFFAGAFWLLNGALNYPSRPPKR